MAQASRERRQARRPREELEDAGGSAKDQIEEQADGGSERGPIAELKGVMSEAAVSVLSPVAKKLATRAAKMAIERGPELLEDTVLPKLQDLGDRAGGLFGGDDDEKGGRAGDGTGKGRRMPIQQSVDVAAPLDVVYDQFTQFEDFPKFMHRVQRVELNLDIEPEGPLEKLARGARFAKRAARADLKRFKAFVEMRDDETGAWRGRIEDSEVVDEDDYADEEESEEPEAYEDEDYEEEDTDEEDERPSRQAASKSKGNGGRAKQRATAKSKQSNGRRKSTTRAKASSGKRSD